MPDQTDDEDIWYMCKTDFEHHHADMHGVKIYGDIDDCKEQNPCWTGCGIVKVRVTHIEDVEPCRMFDEVAHD